MKGDLVAARKSRAAERARAWALCELLERAKLRGGRRAVEEEDEDEADGGDMRVSSLLAAVGGEIEAGGA